MHGVTYHTHKANDKESDVITSPVITFSPSCKIRQMVTLALYKVTVVTLANNQKNVNVPLPPLTLPFGCKIYYPTRVEYKDNYPLK